MFIALSNHCVTPAVKKTRRTVNRNVNNPTNFLDVRIRLVQERNGIQWPQSRQLHIHSFPIPSGTNGPKNSPLPYNQEFSKEIAKAYAPPKIAIIVKMRRLKAPPSA